MYSKLDDIPKQRRRKNSGGDGDVHGKLEAFEKWTRDHIEKMSEGFKTTDE